MKTSVVTIHQVKTNLSRWIQKASGREDVIIARGSKPVAPLLPIDEIKDQRRPGSLKGKLLVGREFFEPLPVDGISA